MSIVLKRIAENQHGTFGVFLKDNVPLVLTLELPWNDNQKDKSCIPVGIYQCKKYSSEKFKDVWEITNVPGRSSILIHAGNSMDDIHGCVAVGCTFITYGLSLSRVALDILRKQLPDTFELTITGV